MEVVEAYMPKQIPDRADEAFVWKLYQQYLKHEVTETHDPVGISINHAVTLNL